MKYSLELKLVVTESDMRKINRAREVLSHGGKIPVTVDVLMKAVEELLERRDPLRKAERAAAKASTEALAPDARADQRDSDGRPGASRPGTSRPAIPARVRHQVMLRDHAQCTWVNPDGTRCPERFNVEFDHVVPWRQGGGHSAENLKLACRLHNQHRAEVEMGRPLREGG